MNNNQDDRFNKLYELLGDDVNKIYDTKSEDEIFTDNNVNDSSIYIEPIQKEAEIKKEIIIEPTKIKIDNKLKQNKTNEFNDLVKPFDTVRGKEIKDKSNNNNNITYEDDIDNYNDKGNIMSLISDKKFLYGLLISLFILIAILIIRAVNFGSMASKYHKYETGEDNNLAVYDDLDNDVYSGGRAAELVNCITKPIDKNNLPDGIKNVINDINRYYRSNGSYYAFAYRDIFTGFTVSYNENGSIFAASTIKAPVNIYLYEMAKEGKVNLDDKLTYTSNYYNDGTGVLKTKPINTEYTIRELSSYAIRNSDNAAHNMLVDHYGRKNMLDFWSNLGTNVIFKSSDNWGAISAHDALIYMNELYKFYLNNPELGKEIMDNFLNAKTKFILGKNNYKVANKSGWSGYSQHDISIILADNPYIVVALSNLGYDNSYMNHFNRVNDLAYNLHHEYWKYKIEECGDIKISEE
ncbi:MAG: serine hydrolase [Bacilli bacterium]|nr:serine hydrolase [Bacilli bacterium]